MKSLVKKLKGRYCRKVIIYFLTWCLITNTSLQVALATPMPVGNGFTVGDGSITQVGNATNVVVEQLQLGHAVIEWSSLDTMGNTPGPRESLNFSQDGVINSAVLNRVMSGFGTQFYGDLNAEAGMRIFIVNPAGIVFGEGSTVNVTQLIASNLNISNTQFLAGEYEFLGDIEGVDIQERLGVTNNGTINAVEGAALIGKKVLNTGNITTGWDGFVVMAAGDRVLLGQPGSKIVVEMDSVTLTNPENPEGFGSVINETTGENTGITAPGGKIVLAAGDIFSIPLHPQLKAESGEVADQPVRVESGIGTVTQSGKINADGGSVVLTAGNMIAEDDDNATLEDDIRDIVLSDGSITQALGGEVITYAYDFGTKGTTTGAITSFEDGAVINVGTGTAEISGNHVLFAGSVNALPEGTIQVDPVTLTIADTMPATGPELDTLYEEEHIEFYSKAGVNLDLAADELITVEYMANSDPVGRISGGSGDITLRNVFADGGIYFEQADEAGQTGPRTSIRTVAYYQSPENYRDGGNIYMDAGTGGIVAGDLFTGTLSQDKMSQPGEIVLRTAYRDDTEGSDIVVGTMRAEGASSTQVSAISGGDLIVNGNVESINKQTDNAEQSVFNATGCLIAEGDIRLNGTNYEVYSHGKGRLKSEILISAGENVYIGSEQNPAAIKAESKIAQQGVATESTAYIVIHAGRNLYNPEEPFEPIPGEIIINGQSYAPGTPYLINGQIVAKALNLGAYTSNSPSDSYGTKTVWEKTGNPPANFFARIEINSNETVPLDQGPCKDCPTPPGLPPVPHLFIIFNDSFTFAKNAENEPVDVLANDDNGSPLVDGIVWEYTTTTAGGILTEIPGGGDVTSFEYTPPEDAVFVWDGESDYAEFTDTFTYKAKDAEGNVSVNTATVTIYVQNNLPVGASTDILESKNVDPINVQEGSYTFMIGTDIDDPSVWIDSINKSGVPGTITEIYDTGDPTKIIGFNYTPDLTAATFDATTGETTGYAQISYDVTDGDNVSKPGDEGIVNIDLFNLFPVGAYTDILESKNVDPINVQEGTYTFIIGTDGDDPSVWIDSINKSGVPGTITEIYDTGDPTKIIGFNYTPDLTAATFDATTGETTGYAQISYDVTDGYNVSKPGDEGIVDIDLFNLFPVGAYTDIMESKNVDPINVQEGTYTFIIGTDGDDPSVWIDSINKSGVPGTITEIYDTGDPTKIIGFNYTPDLTAATFDATTGETTGYAQISYDVTDGYNVSKPGDEGIVDIDLFNLIPVAQPDSYNAVYNQTLDLTQPGAPADVITGVLPTNMDYDGDGDALQAFLANGGSTTEGGSVTLNADGTFVYNPPSDWSGVDSFKYYATDSYNNSKPVQVTIYVGELPPPPVSYMPAAPGLERVEIEVSGCPGLMAWTAEELGINQEMIQVWVANSLSSSRDMQPCNACASLKQASIVLQDTDGIRITALAQVINQFASSTAPPTEEQMASIADVIARNAGANNVYAMAGEYIDALVKYVGILNSEMGFSLEESIEIATNNYIEPLTEDEDASLIAYITARLAALGS